jgi:hypothetical protein
MLKFDVNIKNTLLREALATMLTCVGKNTIMAREMIVHRGLIFCGKVAVGTRKFSVAILGVDENHLCA